MKRISLVVLGILLMGILLSGCAASFMLAPDSRVTSVGRTSDTRGGVAIEYTSLLEIFSGLKEKAKVNLWTAEKLEEQEKFYKKFAKNGWITLHIKALSIGAANTRWFTTIILDGNNEIYRRAGRNDIANVPGFGNFWWNLDIIYIPPHKEQILTIYVVDTLQNKRYEFKVNTDDF